jgi:prepilin-type N-terminal cleavage/methylation domain-containing protein
MKLHTQRVSPVCTRINPSPAFLWQKGFTLIEISIVLIVIGLIIGGILVAQDLIKTAGINATITQLQKYNAAVTLFDTKYGGIPGDLPFATANSYNLNPPAGPLTAGGDGNGLIQSSGADPAYFLGEPILFWSELSAANLIEGAYGNSATTSGAMATDITSTALANNYMPPAKLGHSNSISVASTGKENCFLISGFGSGKITAATGIYSPQANTLTPQEAYNIDAKIDDGLPGSGSIQAIDTVTPLTQTSISTPAPAAGCVAASSYVKTNPLTACSLRISFTD